jgi:hypothetical protein
VWLNWPIFFGTEIHIYVKMAISFLVLGCTKLYIPGQLLRSLCKICDPGAYSTVQDCHLNSIAVPYEGSLTAQNRGSNTDIGGYSFVGCVVTGTGPIYLGRAWGPYSRTVFIRTFFENIIIPAGWYNWGITSRQK